MSHTGGPRVTIEDGQLQGTTGQNLDGETFFKFFGIPYATPPVNELRFKPPQPVKPWTGLRDATEVPSSSITGDELTREVTGSEDCLYLNVFTRTLPSENVTKPRPVMVYIHGGGLIWGSSSPKMYGPGFLMLKDIVLVTFNYRLGALGFLSIDGTDVTGNMGLKDQTLLLKWVQRNIKHFNGDPDNVTLFGGSAGAGSVHAHILSAASKGLFHKAILQSGCVLNPWFWGTKNNAREIVGNLGKSAQTEEEALEILRQVPGLEIYEAQTKLLDIFYPRFPRPLSAVVESPNESALLSRDPREIMKSGIYNHVPLMMGYTDNEGMLMHLMEKMNPLTPPFDMENVIPFEFNVPKGSAESTKIKEVLEDIYSRTSNNKRNDSLTDALFLIGLIESLLYHLETTHKPIYLYRMSISTSLNQLKKYCQKEDEPGACHGDDISYLWQSELDPPTITPGSLEDKSLRTFVDLWTSFAEFGNPTPNESSVTWPPVESADHLEVFDIGEELQVKEIPELKRVQAWRDLYRDWYGRKQ